MLSYCVYNPPDASGENESLDSIVLPPKEMRGELQEVVNKAMKVRTKHQMKCTHMCMQIDVRKVYIFVYLFDRQC